MKKTKEEILARQKAYKAANKEKQKLYYKNWLNNKKQKTEEEVVQERINYILSLFKKEN